MSGTHWWQVEQRGGTNSGGAAQAAAEPTTDPSQLSGLELLRSLLLGPGERPGIGKLMGMTPVRVDEGAVAFDLEPREELYNPLGTVHGGVLATVLDSAMACAVHSTLPAGTSYTTLEIKVNYVRAASVASGVLHCEGTVVHAGGTIATAEGRVTDDAGKLYAHATTTCIIRRPEKRA